MPRRSFASTFPGRAGRRLAADRAAGLMFIAALGTLSACVGPDRDGANPGGGEDLPGLVIELRATLDGNVLEFGQVGAVIADEAGRIYVADVMANRVIVLSPEGERLGTIGSPGGGPAEFTRLGGTLAWMGDRLVAFDQGRQRFVFFTRDGVLAGSAAPSVGFLLPITTLFAGQDDAAALLGYRAPGGAVQGPPTFSASYARLTADGEVHPLTAPSDVPRWPPSVDCMWNDGTRIEILPIPFMDWGPRRARLSSGEILLAHDSAFRVDVFDPAAGSIVRSISRDVPAVPVADSEWEAYPGVQGLRAAEAASGGRLVLPADPATPCPLPARRPASRPAVRSLIVDDADRMWIESAAPEGFELTLVGPDDRVLGVGDMPPRDGGVAPYARDNTLYVVTRDAFDVQSIQIYDVRLPGR